MAVKAGIEITAKVIALLKKAGIDYSKMAGKIDPNKISPIFTKTQKTATKPKLIDALNKDKATYRQAIDIFENDAKYLSQMNEMQQVNFANNLEDYFTVGGKVKYVPSNVVTPEGTLVEGKQLETLAARKGIKEKPDETSLQGAMEGLMTLVDDMKGISPTMRKSMDRKELFEFIQKMRGRDFTNQEVRLVRDYMDKWGIGLAKEKAAPAMQYAKKLGAKNKEEFEFVEEYLENVQTTSPEKFREMYGSVKNVNMDINTAIEKKLEKHFRKKYNWDDAKGVDGGLDDVTFEKYDDELYEAQKEFSDFHSVYDTFSSPGAFGTRKSTRWANHPNNYLDEASEKLQSITGEGLNVDFYKNYTDEVLSKYPKPEKFKYGGRTGFKYGTEIEPEGIIGLQNFDDDEEGDEFSDIEGQTAFNPVSIGTGLYGMIKGGLSKKEIAKFLIKNKIRKEVGKEVGKKVKPVVGSILGAQQAHAADKANIQKIEQYTGQPVSDYRMSRPASERQFTGHGKSGMGRDKSLLMAHGGRTSTGLNYLLGEDDQNMRVPYGGGGTGQPPITFTFTGGGGYGKNKNIMDQGKSIPGLNQKQYGYGFDLGANIDLPWGLSLQGGAGIGRGSTKTDYKGQPVDFLSGVGETKLGDKWNVGIQGKWPVNFNRMFMKDGGRIGFKKGTKFDPKRRSFMKIAAGLASIPLIGKYFKWAKPLAKVADVTSVPIKTGVDGMPSWFKPLVNKVIKEGDDVSKRFATQERQIVHQSTLPNSKTDVIVTQDLSTGDVAVDIGMGKHGWADGHFGQPVRLEYKASEAIEPTINKQGKVTSKGTKTKEEFWVEEAEFTGGHPENVKFEDSSFNKYGEHGSDFTEVEKFATGKNTIKSQFGSRETHLNPTKKTKEGFRDPDYASGGRVPLRGGNRVPVSGVYSTIAPEDWDDMDPDEWFEIIKAAKRGDYGAAEGGRVPMSKGKIPKWTAEGLAALMEKLFPGTTKVGQTSRPMAGKTELKRAIAGFQERQKAAKLKASKDRPATADELEEYGEILDPTGEAYIVEEGMTVGQLDDMVIEHKAYMDDMYKQYKRGDLEKYVKPEVLEESRALYQKKIDNVLETAYDDVAGGSGFTGDYKYDADVLAESIAEQLGKVYDDLPVMHQSQLYDSALKRIQQDLKMKMDIKKLSKPTKTLEGIEKTGKINISDDAVADEFARFMKETDPNVADEFLELMKKEEKNLDEIEILSNLDTKGKKGHAYGGRVPLAGGKLAQTLIQQIIKKYKGRIDDKLLQQMLVDDNPQRLAEVMATVDEALLMQGKGMGPETIMQTMRESWKRKKNASGGRVSLSSGGLAGMLGE